MIRVTPRYLWLLGAGLTLALLPALVGGVAVGAWLAFVVLSLSLAVLDLALALPPRRLQLDLSIPTTLFIGARDFATVRCGTGRHGREVGVEVLLELDAELEPQPPQRLMIRPGSVAEARIPLVPRRRGKLKIRSTWLRWSGPLGLIEVARRDEGSHVLAVIPNVRAVRVAALQFYTARAFQYGLKTERFVGEGSEFDSLREYLPGLDHRAIDWKASARHRKLLCQDFRAERNHQIILGIDTGRLMREPLQGIPKLDHAVNAALLLAYCCLRTDDRVGMFTFDERVNMYIEPQGGVRTLRRLQQACAEMDYSTAETNFTLGMAELSQHLRRRSLVVLVTDFVDTITAELMLENVDRLVRHHLVLFVTLRDPALDALVSQEPKTLDLLNTSVVAGDLMRERDLVLRRLKRKGVHCIDAPPGQLSAQLVNRYLEIKRREMV